MKNNVLITILIAIIVAGASFFGGMKYQQSKGFSAANFDNGVNNRGQFTGRNGNMMGRNGFGNRPVSGEILSVDNGSITVKLQDGSSKLINVSNTTVYVKTSSATVSDLKAGDVISAFGITNSDGSLTAQNVQLNPMRFNQGEKPASVSPLPTQ
jgi:hypothetical protein